MAVPFTFGQSLLQGLQLGQQNRRAQEELAFRKDVQQAAEDLADRQQTEIERYNQSNEGYRERVFGADVAFKGANYDLNRRNLSLAEQAQEQLFNRYVDIEGPGGQTAQIDIRDLLADKRARQSLRLQANQFRPFTINEQQRADLRSLLSGGPLLGGQQSFDYRLAPLVSQYLGASTDPLQQAQRQEAQYQIEGTQAARTAAESALRTAPVDPSLVSSRVPFMQRFEFAQGPMGVPTISFDTEAKRQSEAARATTVPEFERVISEQEQLLDMIENTPVEMSQQVAPIADRALRVLNDAQSRLSDANIPEKKKRELMNYVIRLSGYHANRASRANPTADALGAAYQKAIVDEDYERAAQIQKLMSGNQ